MSSGSRRLEHDRFVGGGSQTRALAFVEAKLVLVAGVIHLLLAPEHLEEATYLGLLFVADFAGSAVAAVGILRGQRRGWALGALVPGGAFLAYLADGTVGLPGMEAGGLLEPVGVLFKTHEALFLVLCGFKLFERFGRRALMFGVAAVLEVAGLAALLLPGAVPADQEGSEPSLSHITDGG